MNTKHTTLKYAEEPSLDDLFVARKFNECMTAAKKEPVPKMLFGPHWREGEIGVLSADAGVGKSLLAVQIAESIATGRAFAPFEMTARPQSVLYLNLKLPPMQFAMRYCDEFDPGQGDTLKNPYKFPDSLHRVDVDIHAKLPEGFRTFDEAFPKIIDRLVKEKKSKVVIIDNLTRLQRSVYGYRETHSIMKALDEIRTRLGISILVLARTSKYGSVTKSIAGSCPTLLSRYADSVFTIGRSSLDPSVRYIMQLVAHSGEMIYDSNHVASFIIEREGGNCLRLKHYGFHKESEHKRPVSDESLWPTIDKVKTLSNGGEKSVRDIAAELNLPKSTVHRYLQMWTEEIGAGMKQPERSRKPFDPKEHPYYFPGREEYDAAKSDPKFRVLTSDIPDDECMRLNREQYLIESATARASEIYKKTGITPKLAEDKQYAEFMALASAQQELNNDQQHQPQINADEADKAKDNLSRSASSASSAVNGHHSPATTKRSAADIMNSDPLLKHALNAYGKDIWIIEEDERGKPKKWHSLDSKGRIQTHTHDGFGVKITRDKDPDKME